MQRFFTLFLFAFCFSCTATDVTTLCEIPDGASDEDRAVAQCQCRHAQSEAIFDLGNTHKVDVLMVIDNSARMSAKQESFARALSDLLKNLEIFDYHIGVVTTDVGSWTAPSTPFSTPFSGCDSFAGDDGRLQATSCLDRGNVSSESARACRELCPDRRFVPQQGARYLISDQGVKNVPTAFDRDPRTGWPVDRGPEYALKCMSMVGDSGCVLSSPLEAMKRALDGHLAENDGFLRPYVPLAVIILTDQDDCSVQLARRAENDPRAHDCATPDASAPFDCFEPRFRCAATSWNCAEPMNATGDKTNCRERPSSYLEPIERYVQFMRSLPSGDPLSGGRQSFVGIWPLPDIANGAQVIVEQEPATIGSTGLRLGGGAAAACSKSGDRAFFGQAQLRLSHFAAALDAKYPPFASFSVCDADGYGASLKAATNRFPIECKLLGRCFPGRPLRFSNGSPACLVGDVPWTQPNGLPDKYMPVCSATCCNALFSTYYGCVDRYPESVEASCLNENEDCYCLGDTWDEGCDRFGMSSFRVWRRYNGRTPPNSVVSFRCAVDDGTCTLPR